MPEIDLISLSDVMTSTAISSGGNGESISLVGIQEAIKSLSPTPVSELWKALEEYKKTWLNDAPARWLKNIPNLLYFYESTQGPIPYFWLKLTSYKDGHLLSKPNPYGAIFWADSWEDAKRIHREKTEAKPEKENTVLLRYATESTFGSTPRESYRLTEITS